MIPAPTPLATYRIQFTKDFRFIDARDIVPYLHELGISEIYASPRFRARRGSAHGYDVADPLRVNSELGTDEEFDDLCQKLRHYGMGLLLDIVPNHMSASHENPWWMDVLEHGPSSPYARYFDIDWCPATSKAAFLQENKVLLPVLGDLYGSVLENRELTLRLDESGFFVSYYDERFPVDPGSYGPILKHCAKRLGESRGPGHPTAKEMRELVGLVGEMPSRTAAEPEQIQRRRGLAAAVKQRLFHSYRDHPDVRLALDSVMRTLSGSRGEPASFDVLHEILEQQAYRLAFWKIAFEEINYRRFFDVNGLVSVRVEEPEVFEARHQVIVQLAKEGKITGLRVDHVDGLWDPLTYLARLGSALSAAGAEQKLYVVVEKILGREETLRPDWQADGTTGYDFLNALNDVFIEPQGLRALEANYASFTGEALPFAEICYARNKQVMWKLFGGEVNALGHHLGRLAAQDRQARDVPLSELVCALVEVTACLPVYRTYIRSMEVSPIDRGYVERTVELARRRTAAKDAGPPAFDFLRRVLLLHPPRYEEEQKQEWLRFVMRWQQFTGPVMAKGLEDTAFYVHNCLISRNEVGGDPLREAPPLDLEGFHQFCQQRLQHWPRSLNATSTHDTKRSEDVRARINVLSEIPAEWAKRLHRWHRWNRDKKTEVKGKAVPTPGEEVLLYQTLLGAWPLEPHELTEFPDRLKDFLRKAVREAKIYTGWIIPDVAHEAAVLRFAEVILEQTEANAFLADFLRFQERIAFHGALNSLSQVLMKITAPGVPDIYQGTEVWNLSLVDPDNRRPVDFRKRIRMLEELHGGEGESLPGLLKNLVAHWRDGRIKLYLTDKALDFRRAHADVFLGGEYVPLSAAGSKSGSVCAFARCKDGFWSLSVAPRWTTQLVSSRQAPLGKRVWKDASVLLPQSAPTDWHNVLTGEKLHARLSGHKKTLPLEKVLHSFPVALLEGL